MKHIICIIGLLILFSCKKQKEFANNANYKILLGNWENVFGDEKLLLDFNSNGKIFVTKATERNNKFIPDDIGIQISDYETGGIYWTEYYFKKNEKYLDLLLIVNSTNDSALVAYKEINNFILNKSYFQLIIRK